MKYRIVFFKDGDMDNNLALNGKTERTYAEVLDDIREVIREDGVLESKMSEESTVIIPSQFFRQHMVQVDVVPEEEDAE